MQSSIIAFDSKRKVAQGPLHAVVAQVKAHLEAQPDAQVLILDAESSRVVEVDFRGTLEAVLARLPAPTVEAPAEEAAPRGPGRPKLGVVAREVTLLPRHWEWLAEQPGGASVALRKLVEAARRNQAGADRQRIARDNAYRFMSTMAGDEPGFEAATRALYAGDQEGLVAAMASWPADVRAHALHLAVQVQTPAE